MNRTLRTGAVLAASTLAFSGLSMGTAFADDDEGKLKICAKGLVATQSLTFTVDGVALPQTLSNPPGAENKCFKIEVDKGTRIIKVTSHVAGGLDEAKIKNKRGTRTDEDPSQINAKVFEDRTTKVTIFADA